MKSESENLATLEALHMEAAYTDSSDSATRRRERRAERKALKSERRAARRNKAARRAFCGGLA